MSFSSVVKSKEMDEPYRHRSMKLVQTLFEGISEDTERLTLEHILGKINPADALTKSRTAENLVSLYEACGLVEDPMVLDHVKPCEDDRKKVSFKLETDKVFESDENVGVLYT